MRQFVLFGLAWVAALVAGCNDSSSPLAVAGTSNVSHAASPLKQGLSSQPSPVSVSASERLHPLPAWMAKRDPAAARAPGQLSRRYSLPQLRALYGQLARAQDAERVRIHSRFEQMPASDDLDVMSRRSSDEGDQIKTAQDHVYDVFRHDHRLTEDQMSGLFQVATDNHWASASQ